jgi:hypothetical protein
MVGTINAQEKEEDYSVDQSTISQKDSQIWSQDAKEG